MRTTFKTLKISLVVCLFFLADTGYGQWCGTPNPDFCPGNQFDNGNFETVTGDPSIAVSNDINLAVGWSELWQFGSLADLFCEGTSPGMTPPAPLSGNFGGMWISNTDEPTVSTWREGMFNQLLTPIAASSGTYTFGFDVANLQPANTAGVEIGIYGINYDTSNSLPTNPTGSHYPDNLNLFGTANSVELGVIPVTGTWSNTWAPQTLTFNSGMAGFPAAGITHIMITHSELKTTGVQKRFMGFDNFCLQSDCEKQPTTQTFSVIIDSPNNPNGVDMEDQGYSGIEDSGGNFFCIAGESYGYNLQDVFVNKLLPDGNLANSMICEAQSVAGVVSNEGARWMNEIMIPSPNVPNGGYVYTGVVGNSDVQGGRDMFIKATDKFGAVAYAQIFDPGNTGNEVGNSVIQDSQGHFVAAGTRNGQLGSTVYAAGLGSNFFPNKWVMEYMITGDDAGWSVTEIPGLQGDSGGPVYGITGKSGNYLMLLLVNGTDGTPFQGLGAVLYDLDNNQSTADVGYSITTDNDGNIVITGSSTKLVPGSFANLYTEIFILRVITSSFQGGIIPPGFISSLLFYNIQDSDNEWARHISVDGETNGYILTGKHNVPDAVIGGIEVGEAFLMSVNNNGAVNWTNKYTDPGYIGSKGARVEPVSTGGYFMTGSIWNNDATTPTSSTYNQFAVRTDPLGVLSACDCCAPIDVQITEGSTQPQYNLETIQPEETPDVWHIFTSTEVPALTEFCEQDTIISNPNCDDLSISLLAGSIDSTKCCYQIDITNNYGNNIVGLGAEILTPDWVFNTVNINGGVGWNGAPTATEIQVTHSSGSFPTGATSNLLDFCLANTTSTAANSQQIEFTWYELVGNDTIAVCDTILLTDCPPIVDDPPCVDIVDSNVECDSLDNVYKLTFYVQNNHPTDTATNVMLYGASGYLFGSNPGGPYTSNIILPVSIPPNSVSGPICVYIYSSTPITTPTNICFGYGIWGDSFCCHSQTSYCVTLEPCECLITSNFNIVCDSNKYVLTFDVTNKSTISPTATALVVTVKNPVSSGITLTPSGGFFDWSTNPLPYNATRTVTTCVEPFPISDPNLILGYVLHHGTFPYGQDSCCISTLCDTIPIPPCVCDTTAIDDYLMSDYRTAVTCGVTDDFLPVTSRYTFGMIDHTQVLPTVGRNDFSGSPLVSDFHHPSWHIDSIGNVYGIAIDQQGYAYAAASANYGSGFWGYNAIINYGNIGGGPNDLGAAGTIYRMDNMTGQASVFCQLPQNTFSFNHENCEGNNVVSRNTGPALGNIVYDEVHDQIFAANWEDGRIYRIDMSGNIIDTYDPGVLDNNSAGLPTPNDIIPYGLDINNNGDRLYFGTLYNSPTLYSIDLSAGGGFAGTVNNSSGNSGLAIDNYVNTETLHYSFNMLDLSISDLEFLPNDSLLVGLRRGCNGNFATSYNHGGSSYILSEIAGIYSNLVTQMEVSYDSPSQDDQYGGVAYMDYSDNAVEVVVSSGDILSEPGPHGIATFEQSFSGSPISNLAAIAYAPITVNEDMKGVGGDVQSFNACVLPPKPPDTIGCCSNYQDFCDRVDAGFFIAFSDPTNCTFGVSPAALNECDEVLWNWGDNTTSPGSWNTSATHTYTNPGTYTICMIVREIADDGTVCWEKEHCITVECGEVCCSSYQAFCDRVDAGYTVAFNDLTSCTIGLSPVALNQCDQVLWNWGDGTTSTSPWNTSVTHTYATPGTYTVCMIVREIAADGTVCWEKEYCKTITVQCDGCCSSYQAFCDRVDAGFIVAVNNPTTCTIGVSPSGLSDCDQVSWDWGDGTTSTGTWNTSTIHTYTTPGIYTVCMIVREVGADGTVCWEKQHCMTVEVQCDGCCSSYQAFCDRVDAGFLLGITTPGSCDIAVAPAALGDCDWVTWSWGDGTTTGPLPGTSANATHTYAAPGGTFTVCMRVQEIDAAGNICWEKEHCVPVTVECPPVDECCDDYQAFCDRVDAGFNIATTDVEPPDCTIYVNPVDLGPCDWVTWIWGDGTTTGPLQSPNTGASHVYSASGAYTVCMIVQEIDADGNICWEKEHCITIEVQCPPVECCQDYDIFCQRVEAGFTGTLSGKTLVATPNALTNCHRVEWIWGDGSPNDLTLGNTTASHTYANAGVYWVCMVVTEHDPLTGAICWQKEYCVKVSIFDVLCPPVIVIGNVDIPTGVYHADEQVRAIGNVKPLAGEQGSVDFKAGEIIELGNGFSVQPGATFSADIEECDDTALPCWDINQSGSCDQQEDTNGDGVCDNADCSVIGGN